VIRELDFPPPALADVPSELMMLLNPQGRNIYGMQTNVDHAKLFEALPDDAPALLRALAAAAADKGELLVAALTPATDGETPTPDALFTLAAWHGHNGDPTAAAQTLVKASYLPLNRNQRKTVDGATVAYAIAARKSALRLRQTATGHEQRSAVVTALSDLGLQEEADRLEERLASALVPPTAPGAYGHSARQVTPNGTDRIEKLLSEDRRDDALRLALREINAVGQNLATGNHYILQHGTTQTLRSLITTHGLTEDLIALADPGDDARGKRALNFGLMLEALDENDRAAAAYRKTLAVRPDPAAAARLIVLELTQGNPSQAAEALALVPQRQQPQPCFCKTACSKTATTAPNLPATPHWPRPNGSKPPTTPPP